MQFSPTLHIEQSRRTNMSFKDKVVLITGASSGIGATTAVEFTKQGAKVVIVARNQAKLNSVTAECKKYGEKPLVIKADLVIEEDNKRIIQETVKAYGKIDVLVNNAGFGIKKSFEAEDALKVFDEIIALNLRAVVQLTNLAVPYLAKTKGNVINISSVAALKNINESWAYCTAKAGLDHFSRCIAAELAPKGIRVNVVNPGPVKTDFLENMGVKDADAYFDRMAGLMALKRVSDPQEITDVIVFLASEKARGVTGANWVTDDGFLIAGL